MTATPPHFVGRDKLYSAATAVLSFAVSTSSTFKSAVSATP
jgi:hypothetical protein